MEGEKRRKGIPLKENKSIVDNLVSLSASLKHYAPNSLEEEAAFHTLQDAFASGSSGSENYLPEHLEKFKSDLIAMREEKLSLPMLRQLSPRSRKKISSLPVPNATELKRIEKIERDALKVPKGKIYNVLQDVTDSSRARSQRYNSVEDWVAKQKEKDMKQEKEDTLKKQFESVEQLSIDTSSTSYFDTMSQSKQRKADQERKFQEMPIARSAHINYDDSTIASTVSTADLSSMFSDVVPKRSESPSTKRAKSPTPGFSREFASTIIGSRQVSASTSSLAPMEPAKLEPLTSVSASVDQGRGGTAGGMPPVRRHSRPRVLNSAGPIFGSSVNQENSTYKPSRRKRSDSCGGGTEAEETDVAHLPYIRAKGGAILSRVDVTNIKSVSNGLRHSESGSDIASTDDDCSSLFSATSSALMGVAAFPGLNITHNTRGKSPNSSLSGFDFDESTISSVTTTARKESSSVKPPIKRIRLHSLPRRPEHSSAQSKHAQKVSNLLPGSISSVESSLGSLSTPVTRSTTPAISAPTVPSLIDQYQPMLNEVASTTAVVVDGYQKHFQEYKQSQQKNRLLDDSTQDFFSKWKCSLYDDLGLNVDPSFTKARLYGRGVFMLVYYCYKKRIATCFNWLHKQCLKVRASQRKKAAQVINRQIRILLAKVRVAAIKENVRIQIALEEERARKIRVKKHVSSLTIYVLYRRSFIMTQKAVKQKELEAIMLIQRRVRGILGRRRAVRRRNYLILINASALKIQCAYRQLVARRKATLKRKLIFVAYWMANIKLVHERRMERLQQQGAALMIARCYRGFNMSRRMATMIYWNKFYKAINIQKVYRGWVKRIVYIVRRNAHRRLEHKRYCGSVQIQSWVRGILARDHCLKLSAARIAIRQTARNKRQQWLQERMEKANGAPTIKQRLLKFYRSSMPFRYDKENKKAILIQKCFRGMKARKRMFMLRCKHSLAIGNLEYNKKNRGYTTVQRMWRGFICRLRMRREIEKKAALKIQCAYRQRLARARALYMLVHIAACNDVSHMIGRIFKTKRSTKMYLMRKQFGPFALKMQTVIRKFLGAKRFHRVKNEYRKNFEIEAISSVSMTRAIASFQFRLIASSFERDLGARSVVHSDRPCYAFGVSQALFLYAIGPKATADLHGIASNRMDSKMIGKLILKTESLTRIPRHHNHSNSPSNRDIMMSPQRRMKRLKERELSDAEGEMYQFITSISSPRRNENDQIISHEPMSSLVGFLRAIDQGVCVLPDPAKALTQTDIDIASTKARAGNVSKVFGYGDFCTCLDYISGLHFSGSNDVAHPNPSTINSNVMGPPSGLPPGKSAFKRQNSSLERQSSRSGGLGSPSLERTNSRMGLGSPSRDIILSSPSIDSNEGAILMRSSSNDNFASSAMNMKKSLAKSRFLKLFYNLDRLCHLETKTEYGVAIIVKLFIALMDEPYMIKVLLWMEFEAHVYLGKVVKVIQSMVRKHNDRRIAREREDIRKGIKFKDKKIQQLVKMQQCVRAYLCKMRVAHVAQTVIVRYIPPSRVGYDEDKPYWYNPRTLVSSFDRPKALKGLACIDIALPEAGMENIVLCGNCNDRPAYVNCDMCDDSYCAICFDTVHCKGRKKSHTKTKIAFCRYCKFQMATKSCITCSFAKAHLSSPLCYVSGDKGLYCDTCFVHYHSGKKMVRAVIPATSTSTNKSSPKSKKKTVEPEIKAVRHKAMIEDAYLVHNDISQICVTRHNYESIVQACEECKFRSAAWRCRECDQLYCHKCLTGLHSIGGPFAKHNAESIPYFTEKMHKRYERAASNQRLQRRLDGLAFQHEEQRKLRWNASILKIQAWWRMIHHGSFVKFIHMVMGRVVQRKIYQQRVKDAAERHSYSYRIKNIFGYAPPLKSDTMEESVLKHISVFNRQRAREYVWKNMDDFGFYIPQERLSCNSGRSLKLGDSSFFTSAGHSLLSSRQEVNNPNVGEDNLNLTTRYRKKKGVPKIGFDVGSVEELKNQTKFGGYRMPGKVKVVFGEDIHETTLSLVNIVFPGDLVRLRTSLFKVSVVSETKIQLDRRWRFNRPVPTKKKKGDKDVEIVNEEVLYRLPANHEKGYLYYLAKYSLFDVVVGNPLCSGYLYSHAYVFLMAGYIGEYLSQTAKRDNQRKDALSWHKWGEKQKRRGEWAEAYLHDAVVLFKAKPDVEEDEEEVDDVLAAHGPTRAPRRSSLLQRKTTNAGASSGNIEVASSGNIEGAGVDESHFSGANAEEPTENHIQETTAVNEIDEDDMIVYKYTDYIKEVDYRTNNPFWKNNITGEVTYKIPECCKIQEDIDARAAANAAAFAKTKQRVDLLEKQKGGGKRRRL